MDRSIMVELQRNSSGTVVVNSKNNARKNSGGDRSKLSGNRSDNFRSRIENSKATKSKNSKRNLAGTNGGSKTSKASRQHVENETPRANNNGNNNGKGAKSKMVDSAMQTSTPLQLQLDGMFEETAGGYQRPCLPSPESESTEYEEDELTSDTGDSSASPLSSRQTSARASFSSKDLDYHIRYDWAQNPGKQQLLVPAETPRCFQDLENFHEQKMICMARQLNEMVGTLDA